MLNQMISYVGKTEFKKIKAKYMPQKICENGIILLHKFFKKSIKFYPHDIIFIAH